MKQYQIKTPDGQILTIKAPEGATQEQLFRFAKKQLAQQKTEPTPGPQPKEEQSWGDYALGTLGSLAQGASVGFSDELAGLGSAVLGRSEDGGWFDYSDSFGERYSDATEAERERLAEFAEANPMTNLAGQLAGGLVTGGVAGVGRTLGGMALRGAGSGALAGFGSDKGSATERIDGALGGAALGGTVGLAGGMLPRITPEAKELISQGVPVPVGQAVGNSGVLGAGLRRLEQAATSVPMVGAATERALMDARKGFNRVAFDDALAPIGKKLPEGVSGEAAMEFARDAAKKAYEAVVPDLRVSIAPNSPVMNTIGRLHADLADRYPELADRFVKELRPIWKKAAQGQPTVSTAGGRNNFQELSGEAYKTMESELGSLVRRYQGRADPQVEQLSDLFKQVQDGFKDSLAAATPEAAKRLQNANQTYARLIPLDDAVTKAATAEGVFTPAQALRAARAASKPKSAIGKSADNSSLHKLSKDAQKAIGFNMPNSGTADRVAVGSLLTGFGGGAAATGNLPAIVAGLAALAGQGAAYSKPGVAMTRRAVGLLGDAGAQMSRAGAPLGLLAGGDY